MKIHPVTKYFWNTLGLCVAVVALGVLVSYFLGLHIENKSRKELLGKTNQAALLVSADSVKNLSATDQDLTNPLYINLKNKLENFRIQDESIRFVYILGYRADIKKNFFYVDSEEPSSKDYSPPGQVFDETTQSDINNYFRGDSFTEGPYTDAWGAWISGSVPIKDSYGNVMGVVGVDISTDYWYQSLHLMQFIVAGIVFVFCLIIIILSFIFYKKKQNLETLSIKKDQLENSLIQIKAIQILAHVGRIGIKLLEKEVSIDSQFSSIFPIIDLNKIPLKVFTDKIHKDDLELFEKMLTEIKENNISYNWCDIRIGDKASGYRHYHIYGNVESDSERKNISFLGVMQDITDIDN